MIPFLAQEEEIPRQVLYSSAATSGLVALLALGFSVYAFVTYRKRGNRSTLIVGIAFLVFALRNVFSAVSVLTDVVKHGTDELILSLFDLALMIILIAPLFRRRRG